MKKYKSAEMKIFVICFRLEFIWLRMKRRIIIAISEIIRKKNKNKNINKNKLL